MPLSELDADRWLEKYGDFELIIDARSPHEFAYSHIKGAKNLYALNDAEHKEVGIVYKTDHARAKALGASYICQNLKGIIDEIYANAKVGAQIGIYCAKGGMRSLSIATVLGMIGYRMVRMNGGYKAFRGEVLKGLAIEPQARFITLFGNTGSFKSRLIRALRPSLDLEALANHLGSVFGGVAGAQPSQKMFEDELFFELARLRGETAFVEGESRKIGALVVPTRLYDALRGGLCVEVKASLPRRVECILQDYKDMDERFFYECMKKIAPFISREAKEDAIKAYESGDRAKTAEILLLKYYDKVYKKPTRIDITINSDDFNEAATKLNEIRQNFSSYAGKYSKF